VVSFSVDCYAEFVISDISTDDGNTPGKRLRKTDGHKRLSRIHEHSTKYCLPSIFKAYSNWHESHDAHDIRAFTKPLNRNWKLVPIKSNVFQSTKHRTNNNNTICWQTLRLRSTKIVNQTAGSENEERFARICRGLEREISRKFQRYGHSKIFCAIWKITSINRSTNQPIGSSNEWMNEWINESKFLKWLK